MSSTAIAVKGKAAKAQSVGSMQWPFIVSGIFHGLIVAVFTVGMPYVKPEPFEFAPPIPVEIINISELTQTPRVAEPKKVEDKPEPPKPEPKAKPEAPKMTAEAPPDLSQPQKPEVPDLVPEPQDIEKPEPLKPKNVEKPKPKPLVKPKITKKVPEKKNEDKFASLLKNLTPDADTQKSEQDEEDLNLDDTETTGQIAQIANQLTISEEDAIRRQLAQCWNIQAGAKFAEDLAVQVRVMMNPDATVNRASILDQSRYNRDSHFRAAADAALRALRNPRCTPLNLPLDKFEQWRTININFDPKDML